MTGNASILVEEGVSQFVSGIRAVVANEPVRIRSIVDAYLSILEAGGKRTRGALTIFGYELLGGTDTAMIATVAGVIEGIQTYLLVIDDVADHARIRRGVSTAHRLIQEDFLNQGLDNPSAHISEDLAVTAALIGQHYAQTVIGRLAVSPERRVAVLNTLNKRLIRTGLGQVLDLVSTLGTEVSEEDIMKIADYKTTYYSFLLPLEVGALLAGANQDGLASLAQYAHHVGLAYQLQDDILGIFGDEEYIGKSPKSDLMEGKQTLLMYYALNAAAPHERQVLKAAIGNTQLVDRDLDGCREIITTTGALKKVQILMQREVRYARRILQEFPKDWSKTQVANLDELALFAIRRKH